MKPTRILGCLALTSLVAIGSFLPQGLSGQTTDNAGVARISANPAGPPAGPAGPAMPQTQPMVAEPSVAAYGSTAPAFFEPGSAVGYAMSDASNVMFGPQFNVDVNLNEGLGYYEEFYRIDTLIPRHIVPGQTVFMLDLGAAVTDEGDGAFNAGFIYRNFDRGRNRIFGLNAYWDHDRGNRAGDYSRIGVGFESLGKFIDFRANGYMITGSDSETLTNSLVGDCEFIGNHILVTRERLIEAAFDGVDFEAGGPLPFLGHFGVNGYVGGYWLDNSVAGDTVGFSLRAEALVTESVTANVTYTNDDLLGDNAFVNLSFTMPQWRTRGWFKPRVMQERLGERVRRSDRIHTNVARYRNQERAINPLDGRPYTIAYVDPNSAVAGDGTREMPFMTLQMAADANTADLDIISVLPRTDNSGTNLGVDGGLELFAGQQLLGGTKDHLLFSFDGMDCVLPAFTTDTAILDPLISNPTMMAGGSVVRLRDRNRVSGFRINAANVDETVFGVGITNRRPIEDFEITCNTIFNHTDAVVLNNVSGIGIFEENTLDGADPARSHISDNGLRLTSAAGEDLHLSLQNNEATGHTGIGLGAIAKPNSRISAYNPDAITTTGLPPVSTGIRNNTTNNNGTGLFIEARRDGIFNGIIEENVFNDNTGDGLLARADAGRVVLRSIANNEGSGNGGNGMFLHYLNNGRFFANSEDANGNNVLDVGEDLNGNGRFDLGIVSNTLNANGLTGLCIFGQGAGRGIFDIGGPDPALGNTLLGNTDAGIAIDLTGTARAQTNIVNNVISAGGGPAASLTFVLDFIDPGQASVTDFFGNTVNTFDVTNFGFAPTDYDLVTNAILATVRDQYLGIPTNDVDSRSPIPAGQQLDVDFIIGDMGQPPSNGGTEFYTVLIGDSPTAGGLLGISDGIGQVRDQNGLGPLGPGAFGVTAFTGTNGDIAVSTYTDQISTLGGLTPPNANLPNARTPVAGRVNALTSGNLTFTRNAVGNVVTHEVGHSLSLRHIADAGAVLPTPGATVVMGTGAPGFGQPNQALLAQQEFAYSGNNPGELPGEAPFVQMDIQQLVDAVGLRAAGAAGGPTLDGIRVRATNNARLEPSRITNNSITALTRDGIAVSMNDNAKAEALDIQTNDISGNGGRGIFLEARGAQAMITADQSIGGNGQNDIAGQLFSQRNTITGNGGDGVQVLAANGGTVLGNIINNEITTNGGNGISLLIERYGTIDFGNVTGGNNRVIENNIIADNSGFGLLMRTSSVPGRQTTMDVISRDNMITGNGQGGMFADLAGSNNNPPNPPVIQNNNILTLLVDNETIADNTDVGVAVRTAGNTKADVTISNSTISGTTAGSVFGGDGINFERQGSSLLTAQVLDNMVLGNAGDGMDTTYSGGDRFDNNQPMTDMINTVTWNGNVFSNSGDNGVRFTGRGDAMMLGDAMNNLITNNASNGILVTTNEASTFGDPTVGLPPGRRVVWKSNVITGNTGDGIQLNALDDSVLLVEITSDTSSAQTSPHASGLTDGDTIISGNGSDGVHITSSDDSVTDVLIHSGNGQTVIDGNGTGPDGGNGIRFDANGNAVASVAAQDLIITNSIAGATEDVGVDIGGVITGAGNGLLDLGEDTNQNGFLDTEDLNGNGMLDAGEDANQNGVLDTEDIDGDGILDSEDASGSAFFVDGNIDLDVQNGDGIQFNSAGNAVAILQVGGSGQGNIIQGHADDGIAIVARGGISALGSGSTGQSRPIVTVTDNLIGGFAGGLPAGNGGDGVSLNNVGGAFAQAQLPGGVTNNEPNFPTDVNRMETGPIMSATFTNNTMTQNGRRGAVVLLSGAGGIRVRENLAAIGGAPIIDPIRINFRNNILSDNAEQGLFYQANARYTENRVVGIFNGPPGTGNGATAPYDPRTAPFFALNLGSLNGNTAYMPEYLNLRTAQNAFFNATGNTLRNNGSSLSNGEGMVIRVTQNAYTAADVSNNSFGGNLDEDFRTESLVVGGSPLNSIDYTNAAANPQPFDLVFLDDTAQLDLRFDNNSGNQVNPSAFGGSYTNFDAGKLFHPNVTNRQIGLFQVDGGPFLNFPNNDFFSQGSFQDVRGAFSTGGYFERAISDPLFPNPGFAPPLP